MDFTEVISSICVDESVLSVRSIPLVYSAQGKEFNVMSNAEGDGLVFFFVCAMVVYVNPMGKRRKL